MGRKANDVVSVALAVPIEGARPTWVTHVLIVFKVSDVRYLLVVRVLRQVPSCSVLALGTQVRFALTLPRCYWSALFAVLTAC